MGQEPTETNEYGHPFICDHAHVANSPSDTDAARPELTR